MTRAETHVARLAAAGLSNAAIAAARGTSVRTVANQIARILREAGVGSRLALATVRELAPPSGRSAVDWTVLTARQRRILALVSRGRAQKVVALELGLAQSTVSATIRAARLRIGLPSLAHLVCAYAAAAAAAATQTSIG
jgi:DNA-binding CsgD family transcriptional regulator